MNAGILAELGDARRAGAEATRRAEALARDREGLRAQLAALEVGASHGVGARVCPMAPQYSPFAQTSLKAGESEAAGVIGGHAARIAALQVGLAGRGRGGLGPMTVFLCFAG